jgi:hypothetical protein
LSVLRFMDFEVPFGINNLFFIPAKWCFEIKGNVYQSRVFVME